MSYASTQDMIARYDINKLGGYIFDNNEKASVDNITKSARLQTVLNDASGMVEAAVMVGAKYSVDDLNNLSDNAASLLTRIVCDIAYGLLVQRRGYNTVDVDTLAPGYAKAMKMLEAIEAGTALFWTDAVIDASTPQSVQLSSNITLTTKTAWRIFPVQDPRSTFTGK